jgi:sugar lactone lactonase YvrE
MSILQVGKLMINFEKICLAFLLTPEVISNLTFGGTKRNGLFMTGSTFTHCT